MKQDVIVLITDGEEAGLLAAALLQRRYARPEERFERAAARSGDPCLSGSGALRWPNFDARHERAGIHV